MLVLYLNIFVRIVQAILRLPNLKAQAEPPFELTQFAFFRTFIMLTIVAVIKFRGERAQPSLANAS